MTPPSSATAPSLSPRQFPVPYLFGGLATVLALISCALLILACSYLRVPPNLHNNNNDNNNHNDSDIESGSRDTNPDNNISNINNKEYLVIMAGQVNPTFLATPSGQVKPTLLPAPSASRALSSGSSSSRSNATSTIEEDESPGSVYHGSS